MQARNIKILGTGKYLPAERVTAEELESRLGLEAGWVERHSGVMVRHFAGSETASEMGAKAAWAALEAAGLRFSDIDCLVGVSGSREQGIPCTAALIQRAMGQEQSGVPAFDIDSTCLSFVVGLDLMADALQLGRYRRVLLVSSEVASIALNWDDKESATIFGDGAAAAVITRSEPHESSAILASRMETYSSAADLSQARAGGSRYHPRRFEGDLQAFIEAHCTFEMDGKAIFKLSAQVLPGFVERLLAPTGLTVDDIHLVVPHQASLAALWLVQRRLKVPEDRWMVIAPTHGNMIAASIPTALHEAIQLKRVQRGDRVLLLGTSAGFSVGAVLLEY